MDHRSTALCTFSSPLSLSRLSALLIRATLTCVFATGLCLFLDQHCAFPSSNFCYRLKCFFPWFQARLSREQVCVQFVAFGVAQHRLLSSCCVSVGVLLGALAGALIGVATASGVVRGSISGAISGALSSVEVVEDSLAIWRNNGSGQWSILYLVSDMIQSSISKHSFDRCFGFFETEILYSLMSGRLVNEKVDTPSRFCKADMFSLCLLLAKGFGHGEQLCALSAPFLEVLDDIFEAGGGGTKGMPKASVDKLPKINIHVEDCVDARSESISCAVCLQEFQAGEAARTLPQCQHIFHLPCIDSWLIRHGSCPLCRHNFSEAYLVQ
ncbi:unnamed protein product [Musa hybrid cultivar]